MIVVGGRGLPGGRMYQEFGKWLIDPHDGDDSETIIPVSLYSASRSRLFFHGGWSYLSCYQ